MTTGAAETDEALMLLYRDGDAGAFDTLYARHKGGVFRYLLRNCHDRALAEELHQDVWMNLVRARASYTVQAKFTTYLYRLAHNRLIDHYRKHGRAAIESLDGDDGPSLEDLPDERVRPPWEELEQRRQGAALLELLTELPPPQREAFLLQQEGGMTVEEIAQATGVTRETAKSRLRYALARLRQGMLAWR